MTAALAHVRLTEVLHFARSRNASDVHLTAGAQPVLRVDGALEPQPTVPLDAEEVEAIAAELLDKPAKATFEKTGDVTTSYDAPDIGAVRIHLYRTHSGVALAMRLLRENIPSFESLHLPAVVASFAERPQGLVIFAGPTGSGKSTALAAVVDLINRTQPKHVVTIEDPIEYRHRADRSIVTQREIGKDADSYAGAVYGALRSDPDVILVGEMREPETIHAALTAAETGHLVLTTLHTGDTTQTVDRIVGAFGGSQQEQIRIQLAQTLLGVVCMRLLPRAFSQGRLAAAEIMVANDAVRALIRDGKSHQLRNVVSTNRQSGMQTLEMHLSDLVARGEVPLEAALRASARPGDIHPVEAVVA